MCTSDFLCILFMTPGLKAGHSALNEILMLYCGPSLYVILGISYL